MISLPPKYFNVIEYIKQLREANFTQAQAEVVAKVMEQQAQNIQEQLQEQRIEIEHLKSKDPATKGDVVLVQRDIKETELRLQKEIETVRKEIESVRKEISQANNKTILWIIGIMSGYGVFFLSILAKGFHWF